MKITIVAFEGCMTSAVYGQADAFAIAAYIAGRRADQSWSGHDVRIATAGGLPVQGYGGHTIEPHCSLVDAGDSNVVLIPPIFNDIEATLKQETALVAWLNSFPQASTLLASTCTGAFLLAEAGILNGRRVTTNPAFSVLFEQRYPAVRLALEERIIDDNMVIRGLDHRLSEPCGPCHRPARRPRSRGSDGESTVDRPQSGIPTSVFLFHRAKGSWRRQGVAAAELHRRSPSRADRHRRYGERSRHERAQSQPPLPVGNQDLAAGISAPGPHRGRQAPA
jgi:hypothetical protein